MDFQLSEDQEALREGIRSFCEGRFPNERFGEIEEHQGRVLSFSEKPLGARHCINGGFMVFNKSLLAHLTTNDDCDFEYGVVGDLAAQGEVMMYRHDGQWACVDHERDVHYLERLIGEGRAFWQGPTSPRTPALVAAAGGAS